VAETLNRMIEAGIDSGLRWGVLLDTAQAIAT
jgi:hypothetical protein